MRGFFLHIKQAQAWKTVFFQQALVDVLLLQLIDLSARHFAAVGREVAVGFGADGDDFFVRCGSEQDREELFFEHGQTALEVFEARWRFAFDFGSELAQSLGGIEGGGFRGDAASLRKFCGVECIRVATQERSDYFGLEALARAGL